MTDNKLTVMSLSGEILGDITPTPNMTMGDFVNALKKLNDNHKSQKFNEEYMTRVHNLSFLSDIIGGEEEKFDVGDEVTDGMRKMTGIVLHHFFNLDEFLSRFGPITWKEAKLRHISVGKEKDSSRVVVCIGYDHPDITAAISKPLGKSESYSLCTHSQYLQNYFNELSVKYPGFPICEGYYGQGFSDFIVIKITHPNLITLTKLIQDNAGDAEFLEKFETAVADGFVPDSKFIQLLLSKDRSFEMVCRAAMVANYEFTLSDLKRGIPRLINENVLGWANPDSKLDAETYNKLARDHMAAVEKLITDVHMKRYTLRCNFMEEVKPFWYSGELTISNDESDVLSDQKRIDLEKQKAEKKKTDDEHIKLMKKNRKTEKRRRKALGKPSEEELTCLRLAPTYNDNSYRYQISGTWYNYDSSDLPESHTEMVKLLRNGSLIPDRKTLFYCIYMGHKNPDGYCKKNPQGKLLRKSHLIATLQAIIDLGQIVLNKDDLQYILDFHHPQSVQLANWLFQIVKPNQKQVYRYLNTRHLLDGLFAHDISVCYLQHCAEPFAPHELEDILIKYRLNHHDVTLMELKHTVSLRYFRFLLENPDLDFHLYNRYNPVHYHIKKQTANEYYREDYREESFNPFSEIVVTLEDIFCHLRAVKKGEDISGKRDRSLTLSIVESMLISNPQISITLEDVSQVIRLGYGVDYIFTFLSRMKEVPTKHLSDIVLYNAIYGDHRHSHSCNYESKNGTVKVTL